MSFSRSGSDESFSLPTGFRAADLAPQDAKQVRILIVDDESAIRETLTGSLSDEGYIIRSARSGLEGLEMIEDFKPQIVLLDIWMPGELDGIGVLQKGKQRFPGSEFVIMSGHGTIETAVKATKLGAWDFVEKPLSIDKILILIKNITQMQGERGEKAALLHKLRRNISIVGESQAMIQVKELIARIAPTPSWVLISGEAGTGKNLIAQNIHYLSPRASRPFVEVNCSTLPSELAEGEIFGFAKGYFAGTESFKRGRIDFAQGGTFYLSEISALSAKSQEKLLYLLVEKRFSRFGSDEAIAADVRVIATTTKNLESEIHAGRLREDLYSRLNFISFSMPSLRERPDDIPVLVGHFGDQFAREGGHRHKSFSENALTRMQVHAWPGNTLELRNFVERLYILTPGDFIDVHDLHFAGLPSQGIDDAGAAEVDNFREARARFERDYLQRKIAENRGNISKTAENIGLERSYLHRKIKGYGIDVDEVM